MNLSQILSLMNSVHDQTTLDSDQDSTTQSGTVVTRVCDYMCPAFWLKDDDDDYPDSKRLKVDDVEKNKIIIQFPITTNNQSTTDQTLSDGRTKQRHGFLIEDLLDHKDQIEDNVPHT